MNVFPLGSYTQSFSRPHIKTRYPQNLTSGNTEIHTAYIQFDSLCPFFRFGSMKNKNKNKKNGIKKDFRECVEKVLLPLGAAI